MSASLFIKNQQRTFNLDVRHLRHLTRTLLRDLLSIDDFDLAIYIVRAPRMAELNWTHLQHKGPTDVITFDYQDASTASERPRLIHGELFICIDEALAQATRFQTTWQSEVTRYVIHGLLHLLGYDDTAAAPRKRMKRREDRLLKQIAERFSLRKLGADSGPSRKPGSGKPRAVVP